MARIVARVRSTVVALAVGVVALVVGPGLIGVSATTPPTWSNAARLPGTVTLNVGDNASAPALSCPTGTSCVAGGSYTERNGNSQGFLESMKSGVWQAARPVPYLSTLNIGGGASVDSVGCSSIGNCSAAGTYVNADKIFQTFVVNEVNGRWHNAEPLPGAELLESRTHDPWAGQPLISCVSGATLDCGLGGSVYSVSHDIQVNNPEQAIVDAEVHGVWRDASFVPWAPIDAQWGPSSYVQAIACPSAGDCTVIVNTDSFPLATFVDHDTNYRWASAEVLPGLSTEVYGVNNPEDVSAFSLSCPQLGDCVIVGTYLEYSEPFIATETSGHWATVVGVPGIGAVNVSGDAQAYFVSCGSVGNCAIEGTYLVQNAYTQWQLLFVASEVSGKWQSALEIPGLSALTTTLAEPTGLSCETAGSCAAAGNYVNSTGEHLPFVDSSEHGSWSAGVEIPGIATFHPKFSWTSTVTCSSDGRCTLLGTTSASVNNYTAQVFFSERSPTQP
jgi:hypothetical protein